MAVHISITREVPTIPGKKASPIDPHHRSAGVTHVGQATSLERNDG